MAPVAGRPFLFYVINQLRSQGIHRFVFSLGYRHEAVEEYLSREFPTLRYTCVVEEEPLGTGGAIQLACTRVQDKQVVVTNGDTLYRAPLAAAARFHLENRAECTLLLKPMKSFDRYGVVETGPGHLVQSFREKQYYDQGLINGGLYLLDKGRFLDEELPEKFSFERDYLEAMYRQRRIYGISEDAYFIDIGIPEDFFRAQVELRPLPPDLSAIDKTWTLLLDRDGVINEEKKDDYIRNWEEFRFYPGVLESLPGLARRFGRIIVVSNQRGVGRGLMTEAALRGLHEAMVSTVEEAGGRIDHIFYCTSTDNTHPDRKPNPGMAFQALHHFPEMKPEKTIMAGNKLSDMQFGRHAGLHTLFIASTNPEVPFPHPDIDLRADSLADFANILK